MRGSAQHEDIRAGAEDPFLEAGDDDRMDLWMLESETLHGVRQLDIDSEIVRVQFEAVVVRKAAIFLNVHGQRRDRAVQAELPMTIPIR